METIMDTPQTKTRVVLAPYNERGYLIGQYHPNARISDATVEKIRDRHEDDGIGYLQLAREFGISKNTIRKICTYERRQNLWVRWKKITVPA